MCGIVGCFGRNVGSDAVTRMSDALVHRGPDDSGVWVDEEAGIGLGHRRLSILDLSPAGHQPMASASGRYVIAFNGEIYNHLELRRDLDGITWRGHSDTETLIAAIERWGVEKSLQRCVGMFAFGLWDRSRRELTLARDRLGEKPLYFGWQGDSFLFASELKGIRAHPAFRSDIDRDALALYMRHNAIPGPRSIYRGIAKLAPGTFLTLRDGQRDPIVAPYWSVDAAVDAGRKAPFVGSDEEALTELDRLLRQSIAGQMLADVELGAFLSGGIDSSTVVALMQAQSARPVRTFSIGFHEQGYDEAKFAHAVAAHLGTEHTELYVTPEEAMAVIPRLPTLYDEPFADSSQIPTFLVSQLARRHVTVSLSGDAGDELFGGYNRYFWSKAIWRRLGWAPAPMRTALAGMLTGLSPANWNRALAGISSLAGPGSRWSNPGDKIHKLAGILGAKGPEEIYHSLVSHWDNPSAVVKGGTEPLTVLTGSHGRKSFPDFESQMMYLDQLTYLPDDILAKVDRAAMGVSLETRVPFLDHRLVEFAWTLPLSLKIRDGQGKWLLRQLLRRHVPDHLFERPKMGFGIPIDSWLRGPLRDWAEALLATDRLTREGFFDPAPIQLKWQDHLSGKRNWAYHLWDVLMFQAWLEAQQG
jgi:asparagine synthase (glutamine-hydrolysing)